MANMSDRLRYNWLMDCNIIDVERERSAKPRTGWDPARADVVLTCVISPSARLMKKPIPQALFDRFRKLAQHTGHIEWDLKKEGS